MTAPARGMGAKRPPYRYCWWCNRQFQGPYFRELVTEEGASFFVHAACATEASDAIGRVAEVRLP